MNGTSFLGHRLISESAFRARSQSITHQGDLIADFVDVQSRLGSPTVSMVSSCIPVSWHLSVEETELAHVYPLSEFETIFSTDKADSDKESNWLWNVAGSSQLAIELIVHLFGPENVRPSEDGEAEVTGLTKSKPHPDIPF